MLVSPDAPRGLGRSQQRSAQPEPGRTQCTGLDPAPKITGGSWKERGTGAWRLLSRLLPGGQPHTAVSVPSPGPCVGDLGLAALQGAAAGPGAAASLRLTSCGAGGRQRRAPRSWEASGGSGSLLFPGKASRKQNPQTVKSRK